METLEFIIFPDGRVKEKVTGIVGSSCAEVTALLEEKLGQVVSQQQTSEYYAQEVCQTASSTARAQLSRTEW
ncbi:MAG: DUF2997 domain-containing protein [Leptolyngbyaceae cyanobacterium MO_188.B28]|nr:DUF2997 domain-containing protein [Leptolyngbyaceae cyanobacterium MO_188.B28]